MSNGIEDDNIKESVNTLPDHHKKYEYCLTRKEYRKGKRNTAVKISKNMGAFACCPMGESGGDVTPDPEERRKQMAEAADRRQAQAEARGVKDPEKIKRQQKQKEETEKAQAMQSNDGGGNLKWNVG